MPWADASILPNVWQVRAGILCLQRVGESPLCHDPRQMCATLCVAEASESQRRSTIRDISGMTLARDGRQGRLVMHVPAVREIIHVQVGCVGVVRRGQQGAVGLASGTNTYFGRALHEFIAHRGARMHQRSVHNCSHVLATSQRRLPPIRPATGARQLRCSDVRSYRGRMSSMHS